MSINTIIVDDSALWSIKLHKDLQKYAEINILATIPSIEKLKKEILELQPFLLFINVEMSKTNSRELLQELRTFLHSDACIVFYCENNKYMIDALRASAFDYLPKSYKSEELEQIVERVKHKHKSIHSNFFHSNRLLLDDRKFALRTVTGLLLLKRSEVIYFQYDNSLHSWKICLAGNHFSRLRTCITAKHILDLSPAFFQANQFVIINIDYLDSIDTQLHCAFRPPYNNLNITISRRYYHKLKESMEII